VFYELPELPLIPVSSNDVRNFPLHPAVVHNFLSEPHEICDFQAAAILCRIANQTRLQLFDLLQKGLQESQAKRLPRPETFAQIPDQSLRRQASRALILSHHPAHRRTTQPHGHTDEVLRHTGNGVYQAYSGGHIELTTLTSADLSGLSERTIELMERRKMNTLGEILEFVGLSGPKKFFPAPGNTGFTDPTMRTVGLQVPVLTNDQRSSMRAMILGLQNLPPISLEAETENTDGEVPFKGIIHMHSSTGVVLETGVGLFPLVASRGCLSGRKRLRVLWQLAACGTPALGANLFACPHCPHRHWALRSCGDRHCPRCLAAKSWQSERASIAVASRTGQFAHFRVVTPLRTIP
jgi:hypothetical protein